MTKRFISEQLTVILAMVLVASTLASAQGNSELAGTWTADQAAAGRGGGISGIPIATTLVIKVSPAEVIVDSDTGSARSTQTSVYKLDGTETKVPGPLGWTTTAKAAWKDGKLVVTTRRTIPGPNGDMGVNVTDVYSVAAGMLTIDRSMGRNKQQLVYTKN